MDKCMSCGKVALLTSSFGSVVLCKNCGSLINVPAWNSREFASMEELITQKNDALKRATANNISLTVVEEIKRFFDEYINAGFITSLNGRAGQTLKVFSNHCLVVTKNENRKTELQSMMYQFDDDDDDDDDEILSSDDKKSLVRGLMSGKLVQTGVGVAISAAVNYQEKEKVAEKKLHNKHKRRDKLITLGERRVDLRNIAEVELFSRTNTHNGYLRFIKKGVSTNLFYEHEYFFFNNSIPFESSKIKQRVESVKNILNERIALLEKEIEMKARKRLDIQNKTDSFEEIRKFKQLLDEGIITSEEFAAKKKELLGL